MQNKNLRKALLVSLGTFGSLASGFANAAEISNVNKVTNKASSETNKQLESPGGERKKETDKKSDSLKNATEINKKIGSDAVKKVLIGLGIFASGVGGELGAQAIYDAKIKDQTDKLLLNWDTNALMRWVILTYETKNLLDAKVAGTEVDVGNDQSYILSVWEREKRKLHKKPEVLNLYTEMYKLYIKLLENEKIKGLTFKKKYGIIEEDLLKGAVLNSIRNLLGESIANKDPANKKLKWKVFDQFHGHQTLYCGMPDNNDTMPKYEITETIKDESTPKKEVKYTATFKKTNGKFSFEGVIVE